MRMFCCRKNASAAALRSDGFRGRRSTTDEENLPGRSRAIFFPKKRLEVSGGAGRKKGRSARQAKAGQSAPWTDCPALPLARHILRCRGLASPLPFPPGDRRLPRKAHCRNFPSGDGIFKRKKGRVMSAALKRRKAPVSGAFLKITLASAYFPT